MITEKEELTLKTHISIMVLLSHHVAVKGYVSEV